MGVFAAVKRGNVWDRLVTLISVGGISIPVFWLGLALMLLFAFYLRWLPPSGMGNGSLLYIILPAVTLGTFSLSYIARITRSSMLESLSQPYVAAARAKGLPEASVVLKHALKNSLIPIVTVIGLDLGLLFERRCSDGDDLRLGRAGTVCTRRDPRTRLSRHHGRGTVRRSRLRDHQPAR